MSDINWDEHQFEDGKCIKCGRGEKSTSRCPQIPILVNGWYKWDEIVAPLLTKSQMSEAGYQTGKKLPAPAALLPRKKSPDGFLRVYDPDKGVPKRTLSDAQRKALEKAQYMSKKLPVYCSCGDEVFYRSRRHRRNYEPAIVTRKEALAREFEIKQWVSGDEYAVAERTCIVCRGRDEAIVQAQELLQKDFVIFDVEANGLDGQIIEIGVINQHGQVLMEQRIQLDEPFDEEAYTIHQISADALAKYPPFSDVYHLIRDALEGRVVLGYSISFDKDRLHWDCYRHDLPKIEFETHDVMEIYSAYVGDYSTHHHDFRWQALPGGDHTAIGDCRATLDILKQVAEGKAVVYE